jgi:hypothetical protein
MLEEYEKHKRKQVSLMRSVKDYSMGVIILLLGIFFFFRDKFDLELNKVFHPDITDKILGAVSMIYGSWRIYRGYQKKYFK